MTSLHCPLAPHENDAVVQFLRELSLDDLVFLTEQMTSRFSADEKVTYNINKFCSNYSDYEGRINFIRMLVDHSVILPVNIPLSYQRNPQLVDFVRPQVYEYYIPIVQEHADTIAALTDDIVMEPASTITITNPRWTHLDDTRKTESPKVARLGDRIELLVDVTGYPEGGSVVFDIFDASNEPAMRIETERGKNTGGTAHIEWVVTDPNETGSKLKLLFEGSARSKSSGKAPIDIGLLYTIEVLDDDEKPIPGVEVEFSVAGEKKTVMTDVKGMATCYVDDPSVNADAKILD